MTTIAKPVEGAEDFVNKLDDYIMFDGPDERALALAAIKSRDAAVRRAALEECVGVAANCKVIGHDDGAMQDETFCDGHRMARFQIATLIRSLVEG